MGVTESRRWSQIATPAHNKWLIEIFGAGFCVVREGYRALIQMGPQLVEES
jgi:hypothetical protein